VRPVRPLEVEVRPPWPFRLPSRLGRDGVARRRGSVVSRLIDTGSERVVVHVWQPERRRVVLRAAGAESIRIEREPYTEGWSIHEIGTARMGDDPRTSVTDRFCRLHEVKNVFIADAGPFVSGGTQNTTWTILAMCWRTMDYLKERMRAGDV